jgi:hypothetical protein
MTTRTRPRATRARQRLGDSELLPFVVAAIVSMAFGAAFLRSPARVDEVSITNPTDYPIAVEVRGDTGGWLRLSTANAHATKTLSDVVDQGDTWTFRFHAQGHSGGEVHVDRDSLEARGWELEIPAGVGDQLRDAGATPPGTPLEEA